MTVDVTNIQRPALPYPYGSFTNANRYQNITNLNAPPSAIMLDSDFNYLIDACRALYVAIKDVEEGNIIGSDNPINAGKLVTTDGTGDISWVYVKDENCQVNSIAANKLINGSMTTDQLGFASVTNDILAPLSVGTSNLIDHCVTAIKIANGAVLTAALAANAVTTEKIADHAVTATQIADHAVTATQIADHAVTATQIADHTITAAQMAPNTLTWDQLATQLQNIFVPLGTIIELAGNTGISASWLECNGQAISRVTYATLFGIIGTVYGAGDGETTFNLPDKRGRNSVGIGTDNSTNGVITITPNVPELALGSTFGEQNHTLTINEMPSHNHSLELSLHGSGPSFGMLNPQTNFTPIPTGDTGGDQPHNNMQPGIFMYYYIRVL